MNGIRIRHWLSPLVTGFVISWTCVSANFTARATASEFKLLSDLQYDQVGEEHQGHAGLLDVYLPQASTSAAIDSGSATDVSQPRRTGEPNTRRPVVLVVHGGGWMTGDKWTMYRHASELAKRGIAAVSINYRLAPKSKFPDQVDDLRMALVWIHEHAEEYHFDLDRVGLYGYSAGGHLVSLVATLADEPWERVQDTTTWDQNDGRWKQIPSITAVCAGGPPTDFRNMPPESLALSYFLGGTRKQMPSTYIAASPICFASAEDPVFKIIHGEEDVLVALSNATDFHQALLDANVDSMLQTLPNKGHLMAFFSGQLTDGVIGFFTERLKP